MTDLDVVRITMAKHGIMYHEITEDGTTCIGKFGPNDHEGMIFVNDFYGIVPLKNSCQLTDFMEFNKDGSLVSY